MPSCTPEFARALKEKLAQHRLTNDTFARQLGVTLHTGFNWISSKCSPSRNNIIGMKSVLNLTVDETNRFLRLAYKEELTQNEINNLENDDYVWNFYHEDYKAYQKMTSHPILEEIFKHTSNQSNPLLILSPKAQFQNIQARVLKGFIATQYSKGNFLEIVPPFLDDESAYFSSLAEQLHLKSSVPIKNNDDFKRLFTDFVKAKKLPTFLLIRHVGNMQNAELLARILRAIIDTFNLGSRFHPIWIAGEKLEQIAAKSTDSIFSIGRLLYYKAEITDIQLLAYEWHINGVDYQLASQILELTGGHYNSVEFCLDYFNEKNRLPNINELKNNLLNYPLFDNFINHKEFLFKYLNQEVINIPTAYLGFSKIVKTLYFDGLLKKTTDSQFVWVNPLIREIGLNMIHAISV